MRISMANTPLPESVFGLSSGGGGSPKQLRRIVALIWLISTLCSNLQACYGRRNYTY